MKKTTKSIIDNHIEIIIILFSVLMIAFMITGGCNGDGNKPKPTGMPTPFPTGFPPECLPFEVDPECPAASLPELRCVSYSCFFTEINPDSLEPETFSIGININECISLDCFNLECEEIIVDNVPEIIIFNVQDIGSGGSLPPNFSGVAEIDSVEYDYFCTTPVP